MEMLNTEQVAALLGISNRSVKRMVAEHKMPAPTKVGNLNRWPLKVIEAWINKGCLPLPALRAGRHFIMA